VDWSDIAAFARGTRELHLVAVDRRRKLVATAPIDPTIFARVEPHIIDGFRELEMILTNPAPTCDFLDDLKSNDVVITAGT
jgi:hypothetical protein